MNTDDAIEAQQYRHTSL